MRFRQLQESLRRRLLERISKRELTALGLAGQVGVKQPHVTNFLNRKRSMSLELMDRVLAALKMSVLDLMEFEEINKRATAVAPSEDDFENVLLVEGAVAAEEPDITREKVRDILKFKKSFLQRLRASPGAGRDAWQRFVLIKVDAEEGMSMYPRLFPGATVLLDRRYTALEPYRKHEPNMYAVRRNGGATVKYVEMAERNLVLRPHNQSFPVSVLPMEEGKKVADYIIGRVCHVGIEI